MKKHAILAALVLAAPSATFADHWGGGFSGHWGGGYCYSRPYWGGWSGGWYGPGWGWYAPAPAVGFAYVAPPAVYRADRYYVPAHASLQADVQRALKRRGYYNGSVDGDIGPRSRDAIRQYQSEHGLPVTGRIDQPLLRSLGF